MMIFLVITVEFLAVFLIIAAISKIIEQKILLPRERIKIYTGQISSGFEEVSKTKKASPELKDILKPLSSTIKRIHYSKKWEEKLAQADIPLKGEEFLAIWFTLMLFASLLTYFDVKFLLLLFAAIFFPPTFIQNKISKRIKKFDLQLNDALSIMANSLRAGFSFFQAMDTVRKEMPDPLSKEFTKTLKEINFGTPIEEALRNMTARLGSPDLDLMITAILIQRQVGGNMAEILDNISQTIRDRIKILGEIKTLTAQGKMSGYIIGGLPLILIGVLTLINPSYIGVLYTSKVGWGILAGGAVSEIFGIILIKKIVSIEV